MDHTTAATITPQANGDSLFSAVVGGRRIEVTLGHYVRTGVSAVAQPCVVCRTITDLRGHWLQGGELVGTSVPLCDAEVPR